MTLSPQADFNIPGKPEEHFAPSGTISFLDGGEQIDLRKSDLDPVARLEQEAAELAFPMHQVTQNEVLDGKRIEFGEAIVEAAQSIAMQPAVTPEMMPLMDTAMIAKLSSIIFALRYAQANSDTAMSRKG